MNAPEAWSKHQFDAERSVFMKAPHNTHKADVLKLLTALGCHVSRLHINGRFYFVQFDTVREPPITNRNQSLN